MDTSHTTQLIPTSQLGSVGLKKVAHTEYNTSLLPESWDFFMAVNNWHTIPFFLPDLTNISRVSGSTIMFK